MEENMSWAEKFGIGVMIYVAAIWFLLSVFFVWGRGERWRDRV